jgi:hypothetical protein
MIPEHIANRRLEGSPGGMIETVKRAFIVALRELLTGTSLSDGENSINIDMEYPMEKTQYPSIFVQFSFRNLRPSGVDPVIFQGENGEYVREWHFEGSVTIQVFALSSLERDRISDAFIEDFAFASPPDETIVRPTKNRQKTSIAHALSQNPYVSMTVDQGQLKPGGQSISVGVPWDENQLCYEDRFSFDVVGDFQSVWQPDGAFYLKRIDVLPERFERPLSEWR